MTEAPKPRAPKVASAPKIVVKPKKETTKPRPLTRKKLFSPPKQLTNPAFSESAELKALRDRLLLDKDNKEN